MRTLVAERCVVTMPRIHHGVVAVDTEQLTADVAQEFFERAGLPGFSDPAREQAVPGEQLNRRPITGRPQRQRHRARCMTAQMNDVEVQLTDHDGVAAGQEPVRCHRERLGVELMDGSRRAGGLRDSLQGLPVVAVLVGGDDHLQFRRVFGEQGHQQFGVVGGVDQQRFAGGRTRHHVGVVIHRTH